MEVFLCVIGSGIGCDSGSGNDVVVIVTGLVATARILAFLFALKFSVGELCSLHISDSLLSHSPLFIPGEFCSLHLFKTSLSLPSLSRVASCPGARRHAGVSACCPGAVCV